MENKILIVEDEYKLRRIMKDFLLKENYKVKRISCFISHAILSSNLRLTIPSRTSFALEYVDYFEYQLQDICKKL